MRDVLFHSHLLNTVYTHVCPKSSSTQELQLTLLSLASLAQQLLISDGSRAKSDGTLLPAVGADAMRDKHRFAAGEHGHGHGEHGQGHEHGEQGHGNGHRVIVCWKRERGTFPGKKTLKTALGMLVTDVLDRRGF